MVRVECSNLFLSLAYLLMSYSDLSQVIKAIIEMPVQVIVFTKISID